MFDVDDVDDELFFVLPVSFTLVEVVRTWIGAVSDLT